MSNVKQRTLLVHAGGSKTGSTAIQNFCNAVYKTKEAAAGDIREFSVAPHDGSTIKVNGMFYVGASTAWERMSWYVRLIDPNGSVAAPYSNIEFHQISG